MNSNSSSRNSKRVTLGVLVAIVALSTGWMFTLLSEEESQPLLQQQQQDAVVPLISTTMVDLSLKVLADNADYAIVGTVLDIGPVLYVDPNRVTNIQENMNPEIIILDTEILSDVVIKVEEDLFDRYDKNIIKVRIPGGIMDNGLQTVHENSPLFEIGERVIVFIANGQSYSIGPQHYTILGLEQGTIGLREGQIDSKFATSISHRGLTTSNVSEEDIKNQIKSLKK